MVGSHKSLNIRIVTIKAGTFYMFKTLLSSILDEISNEDIVKISERDVKDIKIFSSSFKMNII
jgi:hypothetical protein